MTEDEFVRELGLLAQALEDPNRVEIWRVIVAGGHDGEPIAEVRRIYRGSFVPSADPQLPTNKETK